MKNKIIINADDFGRSKAINTAINKAYENGLITDTSIMVTCKGGFDDLVKNRESYSAQLLKGAGCHLCLTLGTPLTNEILETNYVDGNEFKDAFKLPKRFFVTNKKERKAIYNEFEAQIRTIKDNLHISICHLDSHQHIHYGLDLLPLVVRLCKRERIPYLRIPNYSKSLSFKSKIATIIKIWYIRLNGIKVVDLFGSPNQILSSSNKGKIVEAMVHPMFDSNGVIVNKVRIHEVDDCQRLIMETEKLLCYEKSSFLSLQ